MQCYFSPPNPLLFPPNEILSLSVPMVLKRTKYKYWLKTNLWILFFFSGFHVYYSTYERERKQAGRRRDVRTRMSGQRERGTKTDGRVERERQTQRYLQTLRHRHRHRKNRLYSGLIYVLHSWG
jgi:hypothetical protein